MFRATEEKVAPIRNKGSNFPYHQPRKTNGTKKQGDQMLQARPLPAYLIQRFQGWKATTYQDNKAWYRRLAESGQHFGKIVVEW